MSKEVNRFYVPTLKDLGCWRELRDDSKGGKDWRGYRSLSGISILWGHHTVTHPIGDGAKEIEVVRQIHMNGRGWGGIGYNFIITSEEHNGYAVVYQIGDIGSVRAHTPNSKNFRSLGLNTGNVYGIGISVIGMNHLVEPTDAQYRSYHELLNELIYNENGRLPKIKSYDDWQPHWAGDQTACYGSKLNRDKVIDPPKIIQVEDPKMIAELQKQITDLSANIESLKADIANKNVNIESLKTTIENVEIDCQAQIDNNKNAYEAEIVNLNNIIENNNKKHLEDIELLKSENQNQLKIKDETIKDLKKQIVDLSGEPEPNDQPEPEPLKKSFLAKLLDLLFKIK